MPACWSATVRSWGQVRGPRFSTSTRTAPSWRSSPTRLDVGPARLAWGSDMPNVERNCTYHQSLEYLRQGLKGVATTADLDHILGGNILRLVGEGGGD